MRITVGTLKNTINKLKSKHSFVDSHNKIVFLHHRIADDLDKLLNKHFPAIYNWSLADKIASEIIANRCNRGLDEVIFKDSLDDIYLISLS